MQVSRNKSKYKGFKRIIYSTKYSIDGLVYAYKNEKSLWIHAFLSVVTILLSFLFEITPNQWSIVLITLGVVLAFELVNTAVEAVVDMVTLEYNELARIAKDCCSAATCVMTFMGIIIIGVIFGPHFMNLIGL